MAYEHLDFSVWGDDSVNYLMTIAKNPTQGVVTSAKLLTTALVGASLPNDDQLWPSVDCGCSSSYQYQ